MAGALALLLTAGPVLAQVARPSGSLVIEGSSVKTRRGWPWAAGRLTFRGKEYTFEIRGLEGADPDVTGIRARGEAYDLKAIGDFSGHYQVAGSRDAFADPAITLINGRRVRVRLVAVGGAKPTVAATGVEIAVEQ